MARASNLNHNFDATNVSIFNAHFKLFSDMLKQVYTQTADTGQVNWATNTNFPTGTGL